jgi:hypothetical protein
MGEKVEVCKNTDFALCIENSYIQTVNHEPPTNNYYYFYIFVTSMSVAFWSKKLIVGEAAEVQPPEGYILNLQQATYVSNVKNSAVQLSVKTIAIEGEEVKNKC